MAVAWLSRAGAPVTGRTFFGDENHDPECPCCWFRCATAVFDDAPLWEHIQAADEAPGLLRFMGEGWHLTIDMHRSIH